MCSKDGYPRRDFQLEFQEMIRNQIHLFRLSFVTLLGLNTETRTIKVCSEGSRKATVYGIFVVFLIWLLLTFANLLSRLFGISTNSGEEYKTVQKVLDFTWLSFYIANLVYRLELFRKKREIAYLMNQMFLFEDKGVAKGIPMNYSTGKEEIILPILSVFARPKFVFFALATLIVSYLSPCIKIFTSSFIMPCSGTNGLRVFEFNTLEYWTWESIRILCALLEGLFMQQLVVLCSITTISANLYCLTILNRVMRHEIKKEKTRISIVYWRYFQGLCRLFNDCHAAVIYPMFCMVWTITIVSSSFTVLRLYGIVHDGLYAFMILAAVQGYVCTTFVYKTAGNCYEVSKDLIRMWKEQASRKGSQGKEKYKFLKYLPLLKIKISYVSYFEATTALVALDLSVNQIVALLLAT